MTASKTNIGRVPGDGRLPKVTPPIYPEQVAPQAAEIPILRGKHPADDLPAPQDWPICWTCSASEATAFAWGRRNGYDAGLKTAQADALAALAELVACKDLKDELDQGGKHTVGRYGELAREYRERKTAAWARAREVVGKAAK